MRSHQGISEACGTLKEQYVISPGWLHTTFNLRDWKHVHLDDCLVALSNIVQLVCCSFHLLRSEKKLSQMCPAFTIENSPPPPPLPYTLSKIFSLTLLKWLAIFSAQIWMYSQECFNWIQFSADDELPFSEE